MEKKDVCYNCQKQGHWSINCPDKPIRNKIKSELSDSKGNDRSSVPDRECPCGAGPVLLLTSQSEKNPGRDFYKCPAKQGMKCKFFEWCDESKFNKTQNVRITKNQGHETMNCPDGVHNKNKSGASTSYSPTNSNAINAVSSTRKKQCPCGAGACLVFTSHTVDNPGRTFFKCPGNCIENCDFFEWCDMAKFGTEDVPGSPYPMCSCGAGKCRLCTVSDGEDKGRKYFACRVKKGQGACNFFKWQDTPGKARTSEQFSSHGQFYDSQEQFEEVDDSTNGGGYNNKVKRTKSPGSAGKGSGSPSLRENNFKEKKGGLYPSLDSLLAPIGNLRVTEEVRTVDAKPGKCHRCGKGGHWARDCQQSSKSLCFKCGRIGHWMNNCPS